MDSGLETWDWACEVCAYGIGIGGGFYDHISYSFALQIYPGLVSWGGSLEA